MLEARIFGNGKDFLHDHVDLRYVSRYMIASTLAHEDARLPDRFTGLDWGQLLQRAQNYEAGNDDPYGSPIPEQLSKNLLLFPAQTAVRKAVDTVLAEQLVHALLTTRVLELYLNVAQFGPGLYGVCDAAWYYFGEPPDHMSWDDTYQLMGLLPGPENARRAHGGGIDVNPGTLQGRYTLGKINGARKYVPRELDANGGKTRDHLALASRLGVAGEASTQPDGPGSCRIMPGGVRARIKAEQ
ncbi:biosynthetic peptidoglycan transglycosylase [Pseudonocardia sp. 73-21]|uniref:biosynthetic peptidoglycan transglycosylase n=1 Tax=Pseudonocardia sp. 73-21 TaxID=1895809 RepID=UPI000967C73E|nr:biosynthetic peptidoglycan transglycosylase [Pseudonocardia sp. 73-21]OJY45724.1 MAG: hypothetical protein BGP03_19765 [Pseudonocardia sp. 73-21]